MSDILRHHLGKVLTVLGLGVVADEAACQIVRHVWLLKLAVVHIRVGCHLTERRRIVLHLVQDVGELVVNGLDVVIVQLLGTVHVVFNLVDTGQQDLLTALSRTEDKRTVVAELPGADEIEHLREVSTRKLYAGHLIVGLYTEILHQVGHDDRRLHVGRNRVVVVVTLDFLIAILEIDIIGLAEVSLQPLVERVLLVAVNRDDALGLDFVFVARSKRHCQHH